MDRKNINNASFLEDDKNINNNIDNEFMSKYKYISNENKNIKNKEEIEETITINFDENDNINKINVKEFDDINAICKLDIKIINSLIGLKNERINCYMNVILQILIHCKNFMSNNIKECLPINKNKNITINFIKLCNSLNELNYNIINEIEEFEFQKLISPKNFLKVITKTNPDFKIRQQDAIEFWRILF